MTADAAIQRLQEAFEVFQRTRLLFVKRPNLLDTFRLSCRTPQGQGQQLEDQARVVVKPDIMEHPSGDVRLWAALLACNLQWLKCRNNPVTAARCTLVTMCPQYSVPPYSHTQDASQTHPEHS